MTRAVVTGAAGFIGYNVARKLAELPGFGLICVDSINQGRDAAFVDLCQRDNVQLLNLDLNHLPSYDQIPTDVDYVFHFAALNGTQNFYDRPFEVLKAGTLPTVYLVEHYGKSDKKPRFMFAGSSESYASTISSFGWPIPTGEDVPLSINDPYNPRWSYGASKIHGEITTINGCRHFGMPFTIIRYDNIFGPRMGNRHIIPEFMARAKQGEYSLYGGSDTRTFLYCDDAARATIALTMAPQAVNETYHLGGTRELSMIDLARLIMTECNMPGALTVHDAPKGSVARRCPDVTKAKHIIGDFETISLEEGIRRTAAFYLDDQALA